MVIKLLCSLNYAWLLQEFSCSILKLTIKVIPYWRPHMYNRFTFDNKIYLIHTLRNGNVMTHLQYCLFTCTSKYLWQFVMCVMTSIQSVLLVILIILVDVWCSANRKTICKGLANFLYYMFVHQLSSQGYLMGDWFKLEQINFYTHLFKSRSVAEWISSWVTLVMYPDWILLTYVSNFDINNNL